MAGSVAIFAVILVAAKVISVLEYFHLKTGLNLAMLALNLTFATVLGNTYGMTGAAA